MRLLILTILMAMTSPAFATTRYVDATPKTACTGNYSIAARACSGADGDSYLTVQAGINVTAAGDTLLVRAGTYTERLSITASGSAGNYIEIRGYLSETAEIDGTGVTNNDNPLVTITDASYLKLNHLTFQNWNGSGIKYKATSGTRQYLEITDNVLQGMNWGCAAGGDCAYYGNAILVLTDYTAEAGTVINHVKINSNAISNIITGDRYELEVVTIAFNVKYWQISSNTLSNFRNIGLHCTGDPDGVKGNPQYGYISGNTVTSGTPYTYSENTQIYVNTCDDVVVENNTVYGPDGNGGGIGVNREAYYTGTANRVIVRKNNVSGNYRQFSINGYNADTVNHVRMAHNSAWTDKTSIGGYGTSLVGLMYGGTDNKWTNNIFQKASSGAYTILDQISATGTFAFDGNLWSPSADSTWHYNNSNLTWAQWVAAGQDASGLSSDPLFIDPATRDLHLQSASPAIDAGVDLTTVTSENGTGTAVTVADPYYFSDGLGVTGMTGDSIMIGADTVTVTDVDYAKGVITFTPSITWAQGDAVNYAYEGLGPDIGAYEYASPDPPDAPIVSTSSVSAIKATSATVGLSLTDNGGGTISACGIAVGTTANPTSVTEVTDCDATGDYTVDLSGLQMCATHYARASATNQADQSYGDDITFRTSGLGATGDWTQVTTTATVTPETDTATTAWPGTSATLSWSHNNVAGDLLIASCGSTGPVSVSISSATYAGSAMTKIDRKATADYGWLETWAIKAPATGSNTIEFTATSAVANSVCSAVSFTGVDQTTPYDGAATATNFTNPVTVNVSSGSGALVVATAMLNSVGSSGEALVEGAGQTMIVHAEASAKNSIAVSSEPGAASVAMTHSWTGGALVWETIGFSLNPGTTTSDNWYASASKPNRVLSGSTALTHVADDASCPASITGANQWCHVASTSRLYVQTDGTNPGALTIRCTPSGSRWSSLIRLLGVR